ncbi:BRCA1-A complex subunit RAP80 [Entelurus aequoreus]|uniref:BRCA1-A complex subunit RAP80 n=1 Tax=Entelurus aequoreus TaxID=161455 RepID=UPI002B1CFBA6|nr:BRCA1-A complex subunit RAP80 [Entelurus aequoreus]XP_061904826.1 BRCA1-A complex subunit RAP80 [Entelurus aequoreus]XP_061904827.1 BRCA1-A complex subunit RAP80 [Entelurus aequoreus]XP_061904828.1 BRCA1-A complex subunit RAP80 [Entelurus aequoreus]XP_061904829.1 BRCA1-A complex subunit RAP80 [Entelurus aequoreus]XP_061904831.1 BRCA1-A complex subunit RAP80 [Entelurus aequoreus]XP_061904832.1 BRCA1-A complex subunit RAP80 [Entelurus aequoreus]
MPQRKQTNTSRCIDPESQLLNEDTQEDEAFDNGEEKDGNSTSLLPSFSARDKRRRERKNKAKPKEMTEEEMMALALRLSAQEANVSARRVQQEEEAMMNAIKESSQSMLMEEDSSLTWRSPAESNINVTASGDFCTSGANLSQEIKGKGQSHDNKKKKRGENPPPELMQTHQICSGASPSSSESLPGLLDSPQSCDSTQIDDYQHCKSPVFPMSKAKVTLSPINPYLLETCKSPGFVLCSQLEAELSVPENLSSVCHKSPLFSGSDQGDDTEMHCGDYLKSPVFGKDTQHGGSPAGTCDSQVLYPERKNSDVNFSSEESLSPSMRLTSCPPKSPVFPRSPAPAKHLASSKDSRPYSESCVLLETDGEQVLSTNRGAALVPNDLSKGTSEAALTSDMTLRWSEEDEEQRETLVSSPSPVFPEEMRFPPGDQAAGLNHMAEAEVTPETNTPSCSQTSVSAQPTVHYYWGIPFCPRGLDADAYTQVILAQMEVYEKSLKEAQRSLLRKAEWGDGIVPQPETCPLPESSERHKVLRRRGLRLRDKKLSQDVDSVPVEPEEEEGKQLEEKEREDDETDCGEEDQLGTDNCMVCPETQLSDEDLTDLSKPNSPECGEITKICADLAAEKEEMEVLTNGDKQANIVERNPDSADGGEEQNLGRGCQKSHSPELDPVGLSQGSPEVNMECPICQGTFPIGKIEMHAAYCDGEEGAATVEENMLDPEYLQVSLTPRKKRKRRVTKEEGNACSTVKIQEKCYVCQKSVPVREFAMHTELCIQQPAPKIPVKGHLLSALEQIDSRDSGACQSRSKLQQVDVIDLRNDEEPGGVSMLAISNSPIKSFTPISEATDCLIDFKRQQRLKKPSQKRR